MRTGLASTPTSRWFIVVFEAMHSRRIRRAEIPADLHMAASIGTSVSLDDRVLKALDAAGLRLLDDAVDDIRAVADLTVAGRGLRQQPSGLQIGQHAGHGRGADVDGAADQRRFIVRRDHIQHMECAVRQRTGDLDAEIARPQRGGQLLHDVVRQLHIRAFDRAP